MKTTVVYLHGYGSSPSSDTAKRLEHSVPNEVFVCPHLDHSADPDVTRKQIDQLAKKLHRADDVVVIGSSAGGFWADYMAVMYGFKTIVVNPSLRPHENFKKYNLPAAYYDKYKKLEDMLAGHARHHAVAFAGAEDKVVPLGHVTTHYKKPIILKGEGHRLNNMTPVVDMIKSMVGNFPEHH
jgi:hypothetical protein